MTIFNGTKKRRFSRSVLATANEILNTIYLCKGDRSIYKLPKKLKWKGFEVYECFICLAFPYQTEKVEYIDASDKYDLVLHIDRIKKTLALNKRIDAELNRIAENLLLVNLRDKEKASIIHDYVCEKMHYCEEHTTPQKQHDMIHLTATMEELVFGNCCVCGGYTKLYKALCDKANVKCQCLQSATHAWNRIKADGRYYYVDCTWDDGSSISQVYCLRTREEFYDIIRHPKHVGYYTEVWTLKGI